MIATSSTCYPCLGTGRVVGFHAHGQQCPCVTCSESGCGARATVMVDEESGEKLCAECFAKRCIHCHREADDEIVQGPICDRCYESHGYLARTQATLERQDCHDLADEIRRTRRAQP